MSWPTIKICPYCNETLVEIGSVGITLHDTIENEEDIDVQADRFECPLGHTIIVVDTDQLRD